jgi:SAM-dependent MidA family methyltransferase
MNLIKQDHTDITFVQKPYLFQNKTAGITRTHWAYISTEDRRRAAIIITNENIDAVLINQLNDRDNVVLELKYRSIRFFVASMYLDINEELDTKTAKVDEIMQLSKGLSILIAMDSNARSKNGTTIKHNQEVKRKKS